MKNKLSFFLFAVVLIISSNVYSQSPVYSYTGKYSGTLYYDNYYVFSRLKGKPFPEKTITYNFGILDLQCWTPTNFNSCIKNTFKSKVYINASTSNFCTQMANPSTQLTISDTFNLGEKLIERKNLYLEELSSCVGRNPYYFSSDILFGFVVVDKPTFFMDYTTGASKDTLNLKSLSSQDSTILTKDIKTPFDFIITGIDTQSVKIEYPTFINTSSSFGAAPQNMIRATYGTIQSRTTFSKNKINFSNTYSVNPHRSGILLAANTGLTPGEYSGDIIVSHLNGDEIQRIRVHYTEPQVTSLDANLFGSEINISPNPSTGIVSFKLPSGENKINIIQPSTGITSFYVTTNNELLTEDLSHLAKGVYIVKIQNQTSVYTHKLILQ